MKYNKITYLFISFRSFICCLAVHFVLFLGLTLSTVHSQSVSVDKSIHSPLEGTLKLNAVFGDLRNNHFHTGLDFGTNGKINIPIYSIRPGFVSRIKISPTGYGKVLYVDHPNGHTSVYAHCNKFSKKIDDYCLKIQKSLLVNEIDTIIPSRQINIEQGELIAYSGNTGNSSGPHLHFEIRETSSEKPLNPLNHGFKLNTDIYSPKIQEIRIYGLNEEGFMIPNKVVSRKVSYNVNGYFVNPVQLPDYFISENEHIGIAFKGYDKFFGKGSIIGIFGAELSVLNQRIFSFQFDTLDFSYSRYINEHIDYKVYKTSKKRFHKLFKNSGNSFHLYQGNGFINFLENDKLEIQFKVFDFEKNSSMLELQIIKPKIYNKSSYVFDSSKFYLPSNSIKLNFENFDVFIQKNSLFQPVSKNNILSSKTALSKRVKIESVSELDDIKSSYFNINGSDINSTVYADTILTCQVKSLGNISIGMDKKPPIVLPINFSKDKPFSKNQLKFKIYDNETAVKNYHLYVNGKWIRVFYDKKRKTIKSDKINQRGELKVKFVVIDLYDNSTTYRANLTR